MKRLLAVILFIVTVSVCYAQNPNLTVDGDVVEMTTDLDARAYYPKYDINDRLCALIKVTLTNTLRNPLTLEVGGLGVVAREEKESGEVWFYVPAQVRNLSFKCMGYVAPSPIPVRFKEGTVYSITLSPGATVETVTNAVLSTNYLKFKITATNATLSLGRTKEYELFTEILSDGEFAEYLDYGTYYFKVEHPLYETYIGSVELNSSTPKQEINLTPAYGYLDIHSTPEGATAYIDGKKVGITPCQMDEPLPRGMRELRLEMEDYYTYTSNIHITGDGTRQSVNPSLRPRFAEVTLECSDKEAEIWVDSQFKGVGSWTGRLRSTSKHLVETRRAGHRSQSTHIALTDGGVVRHSLKAPVPLYGSVNIMTSPIGCTITIDGKEVGETPYIGQQLVGKHTMVLSKDGYLDATISVEVEHNQVVSVNETLKKGSKTTVIASCADKDAEIYINGERVAMGSWEGTLFEGDYTFEARKAGCTPTIRAEHIAGSKRIVVSLDIPRRSFGSLTVEGTKRSMVDIYSIGEGTSTQYDLGRLNNYRLPIGEYEAFAYKEGYHNSPKVRFEIEDNRHIAIKLFLAPLEDEEKHEESNEVVKEKPTKQVKEEKQETERPTHKEKQPSVKAPEYFSKYFGEFTLDGAYIGANAGVYFGKYFGLYGSYGLGMSNIGSEFSAGPMLRFGSIAGIETSCYVGMGYNTFVADVKFDAGLRLGYDILKSNNMKSSFSVGCTCTFEDRFSFFAKFAIGISWGSTGK